MASPPRRLDPQLLADLYFFREVVRAGGFAAAAQNIGISQGAVSQRIARLEGRIGFQLLDRSANKLSVTPRASALAEVTQDAFDKLGLALSDLQPDRSTEIRVNCLPSFASDFLVPSLDQFYALFPGYSLVVCADQSALSASRLAADNFDVGIRYAPAPLAGCCEVVAVNEYVAPVCAPSLLEDRTDPIVRLHDETPWTDADPDAEWRDWEAQGNRLNRAIARDQRFNLASLSYNAAATGGGVAMGRLALVSSRLTSGALMTIGEPTKARASYRFATSSPLSRRGAPARFIEWASQALMLAQERAFEAIGLQADR